MSVAKYLSEKNENIAVLIFIDMGNWWVSLEATIQNHFKVFALPITPFSTRPRALFIVADWTVGLRA